MDSAALQAPIVAAHEFVPAADLIREMVPLTEQDVAMLQAVGPQHSQDQLRHIRAYHHVIALRLAVGERAGQICAALGLTPQTITRLQQSPQFAELVEAYRDKVVDKALDTVEIMSVVAHESMTALHERLVGDERDDIPIEMLRRISETFADRIGHSPVRKSETANVHRLTLDDAAIERIKALHSEHRRWNDPTGSIAAEASHAESAAGAGALSGAAAAFLAAPQAEQEHGAAGEGEGL